MSVEELRYLFEQVSIECACRDSRSSDSLTASCPSLINYSLPTSESVVSVVNMAYVGFGSRARLLARHRFCTFDDFTRFVRESQYIQFHIKIMRDRVTEA